MIYTIVVDKQPITNPSNEKRTYSVDIEELRYLNDISDTLTIEKDRTYVTRRLSLSKYHVLSVLDEEIIEELEDLNIQLFEGDNYIYLQDRTGNYIYAEYLIKNEFTDLYVTKNEMNSSINQTAQNIELSVNQKLTGYSTTKEMNSAIELKADSITSSVSQTLKNYDTSAQVNSKIEQEADNITTTVSSTYATKNQLTTAQSQIKQTTDSISTEVSKKVGNNEIISKINQSAESIQIDANKISLKRKNNKFNK